MTAPLRTIPHVRHRTARCIGAGHAYALTILASIEGAPAELSAATLTRSDGAVLLQLRTRASEEASQHGIAGTLIKVEKQRICTFRGQRPDKRHDAVGIGL